MTAPPAPASSTQACRICGHAEGNALHHAREMMFGTHEPFDYVECAGCGCVQIADIPRDLARHYPADYYSYGLDPDQIPRGLVSRYVRRWRNRYAATGRGLRGRLAYARYPLEIFDVLRRVPVSLRSRIMDVGCGSGGYLYELREAGFHNLLGTDPFLSAPRTYRNGLTIENQPIEAMTGEWDLIMMHHSFEHMPDPLAVLRQCHRLLARGGTCLLRVPTVSSEAWKRYGVNWVQLDPPRHLYLFSTRSIGHLASASGFTLDETVFDSSGFQFWGSEQYERDIPLRGDRSWGVNPDKSPFTHAQIEDFDRRAKELNARSQGDQAAFFLRKL